jgi:IrrE N-terminal-like domain
MRTIGIVVIALFSLPGRPPEVQALQRLIDVRQIPSDTLRDVALVTFEQGRPIIYYNPALMHRIGPRLSAFFFAHEYGHIHYGHTGGALVYDGELNTVRQRQELEADCYAAALLYEHDRDAVDAALRFFTRLGPLRHDHFHPTGSQRAAQILSCLPVGDDRGEAASEETPGGSDGRNVTFLLRAPTARVAGYAVEAEVWIDDAPVGTVSSLRQPGSVEVRRFAAGAHRYRLRLTVYDLDAMLQLNPSGTVSGEGLVTIRDGDVVSVRWAGGEPPVLIRQ